MGEFKSEFKQICMQDNYGIDVKPTTSKNILSTTTANTIIERVQKVFNEMLRSFDLENNHQNLEGQEDNPFDYSLQSSAWLLCYKKHLSHYTVSNIMTTCVWQRYDSQHCLQSKLGSNTKKKTGHHQ
jgi:hypothetical protein